MCPPEDECINKLWQNHTVEYYSATKNKEILPHVNMWMAFEGIVLSEITNSDLNHLWSQKLHLQRKKKLVVSGEEERGDVAQTAQAFSY